MALGRVTGDDYCRVCRLGEHAAAREQALLRACLRDPHVLRALEESHGLCLRHAAQAAAGPEAAPVLTRLLNQLRQAQWELEEDAEKQAWDRRHEPKGREQDTWRRLPALLDGDVFLGLPAGAPGHSRGTAASLSAEAMQVGRQEARQPAARPSGAAAFGLLQGLFHGRQVVVRAAPARAAGEQRARAARRLAVRAAGGPRARAERHERPPQQQDLVLAHAGHGHIPSSAPAVNLPTGITARSRQGPLAESPRRAAGPTAVRPGYRPASEPGRRGCAQRCGGRQLKLGDEARHNRGARRRAPELPLMASAGRSPDGEEAAMPLTLYLRIVILSVEPGDWCDTCGVPSASTVSYVLEAAEGGAPAALRLLTYCEACEGA